MSVTQEFSPTPVPCILGGPVPETKAMCIVFSVSLEFAAGSGCQGGFPKVFNRSFEHREAAGIFHIVYLIPNPTMKQTHYILASTPVLLAQPKRLLTSMGALSK